MIDYGMTNLFNILFMLITQKHVKHKKQNQRVDLWDSSDELVSCCCDTTWNNTSAISWRKAEKTTDLPHVAGKP